MNLKISSLSDTEAVIHITKLLPQRSYTLICVDSDSKLDFTTPTAPAVTVSTDGPAVPVVSATAVTTAKLTVSNLRFLPIFSDNNLWAVIHYDSMDPLVDEIYEYRQKYSETWTSAWLHHDTNPQNIYLEKLYFNTVYELRISSRDQYKKITAVSDVITLPPIVNSSDARTNLQKTDVVNIQTHSVNIRAFYDLLDPTSVIMIRVRVKGLKDWPSIIRAEIPSGAGNVPIYLAGHFIATFNGEPSTTYEYQVVSVHGGITKYSSVYEFTMKDSQFSSIKPGATDNLSIPAGLTENLTVTNQRLQFSADKVAVAFSGIFSEKPYVDYRQTGSTTWKSLAASVYGAIYFADFVNLRYGVYEYRVRVGNLVTKTMKFNYP